MLQLNNNQLWNLCNFSLSHFIFIIICCFFLQSFNTYMQVWGDMYKQRTIFMLAGLIYWLVDSLDWHTDDFFYSFKHIRTKFVYTSFWENSRIYKLQNCSIIFPILVFHNTIYRKHWCTCVVTVHLF